MYSVSTDFNNAVFGDSPETRVLLKFANGAILTNEDIHMASGLKLMEAVNMENELTIGSCTSTSVNVAIMNYHRRLSTFSYPECEISLGVRIGTGVFHPTVANVTAIKNFNESGTSVVTGHSTMPYLMINGSAAASQPPFPVDSIVVHENDIVCFALDGQSWVTPGSTLTINTHIFMREKYKVFAQAGRGITIKGNVLHDFYPDGTIEKYEYAKLGTFLFEKPETRNADIISAVAYDKMTLFDVDASDFFDNLTYPRTIRNMFEALCGLVGVEYVSSTFINSTRSFSKSPLKVQNPNKTAKLTAKDILRWIAEAAGSFARMSRDGKLELVWLNATDIKIPMTQCFLADIAEYNVARVGKLEVFNSEVNVVGRVGTGTNSYQIVDNPFLLATTSAIINTYATPIYNQLRTLNAFKPVATHVTCNWAIQAGDIVTLEFDGAEYMLPIYCQTITWNGFARVVYESTGSARRPPIDATSRYVFTQGSVSAQAVKQGVPYNNVEITHEKGLVIKAVVDGVNIEVRQNAQEGFALYQGTKYLGGLRVIGGQAVLVSTLITNNPDGDHYAIIGEETVGSVVRGGINIYNKSFSTSVPTLSLFANPSGFVEIMSRGKGTTGNGISLQMTGKSGKALDLKMNAATMAMEMSGSFSANNVAGIGLDSNGTYFYDRNSGGKKYLSTLI